MSNFIYDFKEIGYINSFLDFHHPYCLQYYKALRPIYKKREIIVDYKKDMLDIRLCDYCKKQKNLYQQVSFLS